jgi:hypothetical protein
MESGWAPVGEASVRGEWDGLAGATNALWERAGPPRHLSPSIWEAETSPGERYRTIASLFEQVWQDNGLIVAVKPRASFARYFQTDLPNP